MFSDWKIRIGTEVVDGNGQLFYNILTKKDFFEKN